MSIALQLLIGLSIGAVTLSLLGWSAVLVVAALLFVLELWHDLHLYRAERHG